MTDREKPAGRFITLEGGEGSGKTTAVAALGASLSTAGLSVLTTREPGGALGSEEIRRLLVEGAVDRWDPMAEALLHFAARREHVERTIRPALEAGTWVVCDRFFDSTMAYQGYAQGVGPETVRRLQEIVLGDFAPDLTFILDLPPEAGLARETNPGIGRGLAGSESRFARMGVEFHARVRGGFLAIAAAEPGRCVVIDGSRTPGEVQEAIWDAVTARTGVPANA